MPEALKEDLEELLRRSQPTVLTFSTARKLKKHLEDNGNEPEEHGDVSILLLWRGFLSIIQSKTSLIRLNQITESWILLHSFIYY